MWGSRHATDSQTISGFTGSLAFAARPNASAAAPSEGPGLYRTVLDLGHQGTRGGPVATLPDGSLIWVATEPEAPYLAREMWQITRLTMRRSGDHGRSWAEPQVIASGTRDYSVLSHALRMTRGGTLLHVYVRYHAGTITIPSHRKNPCAKHIASARGITAGPGPKRRNCPPGSDTSAMSSPWRNSGMGGWSILLRS